MELAPLIYDLTIMLGVAAVVVLIFQRIHQPVVLGYLVAGVLIGPYTWSHNLLSEVHDIKTLSELGVIFLMFSLGLEFSFHKLVRVGFSAAMTGVLEIILMLFIGYVLGRMLGWTDYESIFLGATLSISSTTIIIKAIDELKLKTRRFAELIFGILVVEDLLAILLLVALSTLVLTNNVFSREMMFAVVKLILVVGAWFLAGYFLVPSLFRQIAKYISAETLTIVSVALCLFMVSIAAHFHYSAALGAFIMGSIIAETVVIHRVEELIKPIRDIFAAVFFISVGMLIDPKVIIEHWPLVLLFSLVTIIGKIITTGVGALLTGQSLQTSIRVGFGMAQIGEFSFIIAGLGVVLNVTNSMLYPLIVAVSAVTTFTTPYMIRFSGYVSTHLEKKLPDRAKYFLQNYATWVYRATATTNDQPWFRRISMRVILNGMIVAIVFSLTDQFIFPHILQMIDNLILANIFCLCVAIGLSSPFIWGMLFSYKYAELPAYGKSTVNPAVFIIWLITLVELSFFSIVYFDTWMTILVFALLAIGFFATSYRHLETSYQWFERQFVGNIKKDKVTSRYEELAPWDNHLVEMTVGMKSPLVGKPLSETRIRKKYGINVVGICQGAHLNIGPRSHDVLQPMDRLIVLGNDEQIEALRMEVEVDTLDYEPGSFLDNFALKTLLVKNRLAGKTIRESKIRERVNGTVVGLERDQERILNPDTDMVLKKDDLLFVVGETEKMRQL